MTVFKRAEDDENLIFRLFNANSKSESGTLKIYGNIKKAYITNLNEVFIKEIEVDSNGIISLDVLPNKIVTIKVER